MIVRSEQAAEELAAGGKAGSRIGDKEDDDDSGCHQHQDMAVIPVPV